MGMRAAVMMILAAGPALAAPVLDGIDVAGDQAPAVRLHLSAPAQATAHRIPARADAPARIYIDLGGAALGAALPHVITGAGPVLRVRAAQFDPTTVRVVIDLERSVPFALRQADETITLDLEMSASPAAAMEPPAPPPAPAPPATAMAAPVPAPAPASTAGPMEPAGPAPAPAPPAAAMEPPAPAQTAAAVEPPAPALAPAPPPSDDPSAPSAGLVDASAPAAPEPPAPALPPQPPTPKAKRRTAARPLASHPPLVVLDAGHGGRDPGAEGIGGVLEKDIVLEVTQMVASRLTARLPVDVLLTRTDDSFVPIDERVAMPGDGATLFISLHANACSDPSAQGLEVFYGGGGVRTASTPGGSWRAALLGRCLDHALQSRVGGVRGEARPGPFGVLVRNPAPSALVEIGYLTHPGEAARAQDRRYPELLADAVADGVAAFLRASAPPL
jgi:N-acetylmuramoyl-L-alanine amidase